MSYEVGDLSIDNTVKLRQFTTSKSHERRTFMSKAVTNCPICNENHKVYTCSVFNGYGMLVKERRTAVSDCFNCLSIDHRCSDCKSSGCSKCGYPHHIKLHFDNQRMQDNTNGRPVMPADQIKPSTSCHIRFQRCAHVSSTMSQSAQVALATAIVHVNNSQGSTHECQAVLDWISSQFYK